MATPFKMDNNKNKEIRNSIAKCRNCEEKKYFSPSTIIFWRWIQRDGVLLPFFHFRIKFQFHFRIGCESASNQNLSSMNSIQHTDLTKTHTNTVLILCDTQKIWRRCRNQNNLLTLLRPPQPNTFFTIKCIQEIRYCRAFVSAILVRFFLSWATNRTNICKISF